MFVDPLLLASRHYKEVIAFPLPKTSSYVMECNYFLVMSATVLEKFLTDLYSASRYMSLQIIHTTLSGALLPVSGKQPLCHQFSNTFFYIY